jgi:hypothetical protein
MPQVPEEAILARLRRLEDALTSIALPPFDTVGGKGIEKVDFSSIKFPEFGGLSARLLHTRSLADENLLEKIRKEEVTRRLRDEDLSKKVGVEILSRTVTTDGLEATIAQEAVTRANADGSIEASLATEVAARQSGDISLAAQVDVEESARIAADGSIQAALDIEVSAREDGDDDLEALVATEQTARIAADGTITAQVLSEISARQAADTTLTASIASEATSRIAADNSLSATLTTETAARVSGDNALSAQVDTEESARISADGVIEASLDVEVSARIAGDDAVEALVSTEAATRASDDGSLAAEYVLTVSTSGTGQRRVAGFRVTNLGGAGGSTEFVVQADKFAIVHDDGSAMVAPFAVVGGVVYIDTAIIRDLTVGTTKLADNAVTIPVSAYSSGTLGGATSARSIQSLSIDSEGGPILILASFKLISGSLAGTATIKIQRDGSDIYSTNANFVGSSNYPIAMNIMDTPGSGSHTYEIELSSTNTTDAGERSLSALELKK